MAVSRLNLGTTNQVLVKAAAGQTSNILEAQNSSGSVVAGLTQAGVWSGSAAPGLVLLNTTSFSGVASISLPASTFSSTYRNYRIVIDANSSADTYMQIRFRASGTDNTAANYGSGFIYQNTNNGASTPTQDVQGNATSSSAYRVGYFITGDNPYYIDVFQPQITGKTFGTFQQSRSDGVVLSGGLLHTGSVSFDSMTFYPSAGTITGSVKAYGYNQ